MYSREHNGQPLTLGVSGKLWKNARVMYDRETRTLWSHLTGEALVGPLAFTNNAQGYRTADTTGGQWNLLTGEGSEDQMLTPLPHLGV